MQQESPVFSPSSCDTTSLDEESRRSVAAGFVAEVVASPFAQVWVNGRVVPACIPCKVKVGDVLVLGSLRYTFRLRRVSKSAVVRIFPSLSGSQDALKAVGAHHHHSNAVILRTEFSFSDTGAIREAAARVCYLCSVAIT